MILEYENSSEKGILETIPYFLNYHKVNMFIVPTKNQQSQMLSIKCNKKG
jgi:hypothetical protein